MAYKLVQYDGRPVLKLSPGKVSLPGEKQVWRHADVKGTPSHDVIGLRNERPKAGEPLLQPVMKDGKTISEQPSLKQLQAAFAEEFGKLPDRYKALREPPTYPVEVSSPLQELYDQIELEHLRTGEDAAQGAGPDRG